jgi:hypothetical protein
MPIRARGEQRRRSVLGLVAALVMPLLGAVLLLAIGWYCPINYKVGRILLGFGREPAFSGKSHWKWNRWYGYLRVKLPGGSHTGGYIAGWVER